MNQAAVRVIPRQMDLFHTSKNSTDICDSVGLQSQVTMVLPYILVCLSLGVVLVVPSVVVVLDIREQSEMFLLMQHLVHISRIPHVIIE